jgi:hypothetical protein
MRSFLWVAGVLWTLFPGLATAAEAAVPGPGPDDWSAVAAVAKSLRLPILLVFVGPDCGYCARLEAEVVRPLQQSDASPPELLVQEFSIDTEGKITDFDGERIRARVFMHRYGVFATPTAVLLDVSGQPIAEPIVGFSDRDDYQTRLRLALAQATEPALPPQPRLAGVH